MAANYTRRDILGRLVLALVAAPVVGVGCASTGREKSDAPAASGGPAGEVEQRAVRRSNMD